MALSSLLRSRLLSLMGSSLQIYGVPSSYLKARKYNLNALHDV